MTPWLFWLLMTFCWSMCMSFFSTQEMACISYNRLKLEVQARAGLRKAKWIQGLLSHPTALFGTTLVGVNLCLVITSECLRQLFTSLSWNPNLSVFILVPYLMLFGELLPMFAARAFPEHTAKLGSPIIWFLSIVIRPFAYLLEKVLRLCFKPLLATASDTKNSLFQHEELQEMLRPLASTRREEDPSAHLFLSIEKMRTRSIVSYMLPLDHIVTISHESTVLMALHRMKLAKIDLIAANTKRQTIVGLITLEKLLLANEKAPLYSLMQPIPYIQADEKSSDVLSKMIQEQAHQAFVLNRKGDIIGVLLIDALLEDFIPKLPDTISSSILHISKTIDGKTKIVDFFKKYELPFHEDALKEPDETFSDYIGRILDRKPKIGESVQLASLELTVRSLSLRGAKRIYVQSLV